MEAAPPADLLNEVADPHPAHGLRHCGVVGVVRDEPGGVDNQCLVQTAREKGRREGSDTAIESEW